jgi:murein L,D-transpeptidase YcbB/YkuD
MKLLSLRLLLISGLILFLHSDCSKKLSEPDQGLNEKLKFSESEYYNAIKSRFNDENFLKDSSFQYLDTLKDFYAERNFQPVYLKSFEEKYFVDSILIIFKKAVEHGLNPEQYHLSLITSDFYKSINDNINNPDRLTLLANSELFLADAVLKYACHMRYGVVNPKDLFPDSYYLPVPDSSKRDLFEPLRKNNIVQYLHDIQPKSKNYKRLQAVLERFKTYKNLKWEVIPLINKKIEPGDNCPYMKLIADRLINLGFLDSSKVKMKDFSVYDSLLLEPVKKFQRLNGLNEDGVIGKGTIEKLNITPEEYIKKIKINLERLRWIDYSDTSRYIVVNIPDFRLHVVENNKELFNIKVCTGKKRPVNFEKRLKVYKKTKRLWDKPDDWETPCMYGEISNLILNPTWTVPANIIREEILAGIKKDSSYLFEKNFKVYKDGVEINYKDVKIKELAANNIPYRIVQDPGAGNALGKIKFMFTNPFGIYLHDTPARAPFSLSNRAVSHGCIRVEKPLMFADYILKNNSKWNIDYLKIEIGQKIDDKLKISEYYKKRNELRKNRSFGKTTEVVLDKKIPLFVDYYTAWVDDNGEINFRDDVYDQDKILMEYLFRNEISK